MTLAEAAFAATTAEAASAAFFNASQRLGATYQQTRVYRRPDKPLTNESHWVAGGVVARFAPDDWPGSTAFDYVCFQCNPLLDAIRHGRTRYRFSDFPPRQERAYGDYWVAQGKSDWEIAVILGVSGTTARWRVDNGPRKLGAVNRAQAIARTAAAGLL